MLPLSVVSTCHRPPDAVPSIRSDELLRALAQTNFEVSTKHQMFADRAKLDILPTIVSRAHDTVKLWATELLTRVEEPAE